MKNTPQVFVENDRFILKGFGIPFIITLVFGLIMLLAFFGPFLILTYIINSGEGIKFGFFIGLAILWGIAYYFFRVLSWNINGVEVYEVNKNEIKFTAGTKYLKLKTDEIEKDGLKIDVEKLEKRMMDSGEEDYICLISFVNKDKKINSNIKIPLTLIEYLKQKLKDDFQLKV